MRSLSYIYENQLKLAWTSFEPVGNGHWEYLEKKAYEIPITENADEGAKSADEVMLGYGGKFCLGLFGPVIKRK